MIENVRLDGFELIPDLIGQEEINLDREAIFSLLTLRNYDIKVLRDNRMLTEISLYIYPI